MADRKSRKKKKKYNNKSSKQKKVFFLVLYIKKTLEVSMIWPSYVCHVSSVTRTHIFKGGVGEGWGIKMGLYPHSTEFKFICLMCSPICLVYRVIQDFVQKTLFFCDSDN